MNEKEFEIGEFVIISDLGLGGIIMGIENTKMRNGEHELRYIITCPGQPPMSLKENQIVKSPINSKYKQDYLIEPDEDDYVKPFSPSYSKEPTVKKQDEELINLDSPVPKEIEDLLLGLLIDRSLDNNDKEEFFRLTEIKRENGDRRSNGK